MRFEEIVEQVGDVIVEETLRSYEERRERGMIFVEENGRLRLAYGRSWYGMPGWVLLPIPQGQRPRSVVAVHTHIGSPSFSLQDFMNFAYSRTLDWLCVSTIKKGKVLLRGARVKTLAPRVLPVVIAYLESKLYEKGIPTGPRVEIREAIIGEVKLKYRGGQT